MKTIKSISLACRVVMDLHALNNEGSESNRLMTRQVGIVTPATNEQGELETNANGTMRYRRDVVNAISGDMNKHIFADAFRNIALDMGLPVCEACQALDPVRMMANDWFKEGLKNNQNDDYWDTVKGKKKEERVLNAGRVVDRLLTCCVDDICGIMITEGTSIKRKSAIEFGWTVGLPEITRVEEFIHARHAPTRLTRFKAGKDADQEEREDAADEKAANTGQMIFNRPTSSGVYAFVAHLDLAAIGFNDYTQLYPTTPYNIYVDRLKRAQAAILALVQTLLHPKGALTSTQMPHVVDLEGFISVSTSSVAAPLVSPLNDQFKEQANDRAMLLNKLYGQETVTVHNFRGGTELLQQASLIIEETEPGHYTRVS